MTARVHIEKDSGSSRKESLHWDITHLFLIFLDAGSNGEEKNYYDALWTPESSYTWRQATPALGHN